jgi:hypothetical protein
MTTRDCLQLSLAVLGVLSCAGAVLAQKDPTGTYKPLSRVGGFAQSELNSIYSEDVGSGLSVSSLNSIALQNARYQGGYVGQMTTQNQSAPRIGLQPGGGSALNKPFSNFSASPTTSPYLNLFRDDFGGNSDFNYNTLVRPQLQQQQFNQQVQRQGVEMTRRLQSIAAQGAFNPQGSKDQYPTGHQTTFKYFGHYHPNAPYRPGKQAP